MKVLLRSKLSIFTRNTARRIAQVTARNACCSVAESRGSFTPCNDCDLTIALRMSRLSQYIARKVAWCSVSLRDKCREEYDTEHNTNPVTFSLNRLSTTSNCPIHVMPVDCTTKILHQVGQRSRTLVSKATNCFHWKRNRILQNVVESHGK